MRHTWFSSLSSFIDQDRPKLQLGQPRITSTYTSAANNICGTQNLLLALPYQRLVLPLIIAAQLSLLVLEHDQLLQLHMGGAVRNLLVECQESDTRIEGLARFCGQPHDFETSRMDFLR